MKRLIYLVTLPLFLVGCTLSFSNISTHGTATDLVDEEQAASPTVSPTITVPISAVPK